jgi:hypothetical protein
MSLEMKERGREEGREGGRERGREGGQEGERGNLFWECKKRIWKGET